MEQLTEKQQKVLDFIQEFTQASQMSPTVREVAAKFNITIGPAQKYLQVLIKKGHLKHTPAVSRGLSLKSHTPSASVPLLGSVHAGTLLEPLQDIENYIPIEPSAVRGGDHFALHVKGDSMTGSGIYEGDIIIVRKQSAANNGDIVVAMVDDEAAVKKLTIENKLVYLESTNPKYKPIFSRNITIIGKVVHLKRTYQ